eukprot:scaffold667878_cov24-Prasinocladus_malaysianus.AAC.1
MVWVWDLAESLGWSKGRGVAESVGPWQSGWDWHDDSARLMDRASRPLPLGALRCDTSLPFVDICLWQEDGTNLPTTQ